jgi:Uncharacterised protein family (UPF0139)
MNKALFMKVTSGDPRRPQEVQAYTRPSNPTDDQHAQVMLLLSMVLSLLAIVFKQKLAALIALICSCCSFANSSVDLDYKQVISAASFIIVALVSTYVPSVTRKS